MNIKATRVGVRGMLGILFLLTIGRALAAPEKAAGKLGVFEGSGDVGAVLHPGSVEYDTAKGTYTIAGSGENMISSVFRAFLDASGRARNPGAFLFAAHAKQQPERRARAVRTGGGCSGKRA